MRGIPVLLASTLVAALFSTTAPAQDNPQVQLRRSGPPGSGMMPQQQPAAQEPDRVPVETKLRYICKQLNLTSEQWQHAEGLFAVLKIESDPQGEELTQRMEQIRATAAEMLQARQAGDTERAEELSQRLRDMVPSAEAERNFVQGMLPALNADQKEQFQTLLDRYKNAKEGDLELKPIEVYRIAKARDLTQEQQAKLRDVTARFRDVIAPTGEAQKKPLLDRYISDVREMLTPEQQQAFDAEIDQRRVAEEPVVPATEKEKR